MAAAGRTPLSSWLAQTQPLRGGSLLPTATREGHAAVPSGLCVQVAVVRKLGLSLGRRLSGRRGRRGLSPTLLCLSRILSSGRDPERIGDFHAGHETRGPGGRAEVRARAALSSGCSTTSWLLRISLAHLGGVPVPPVTAFLSSTFLGRLCLLCGFCLFLCLRLPDAEPLRAATLPYSLLSSWGPARRPAQRAPSRLRGAKDQASGQALPVWPVSAFTELPSVPYPGIGHQAAVREWGPRAWGLHGPLPAHGFIHVGVISRSRVSPDSCLEPADVRGARDPKGIWYHPTLSRNMGWHFLSCSRVWDPPQSWTPRGRGAGPEDLIS